MEGILIGLLIFVASVVIAAVLLFLFLWKQRVREKHYDVAPAAVEPNSLTYICISLPKRRHKLESVRKSLAKAGVSNVEVFEAINGKEINLDLLDSRLLTRGYKKHFESKPEHLGHLGAAFSHVGVFRLMVESQWKRMVVFEDDIVVDEAFQLKLHNLLQQLDLLDPTWDILQLGFSCSYNSYHKCHRNDGLEKLGDGNLVKLGYAIGLFGYVVNSPSSAHKVLESMFPISWHIDHFLQDLNHTKKINCYGAVPNLVFHPGTFEISSFKEKYTINSRGYHSDTNH